MKEKKVLAPIRERVMFFVGREETLSPLFEIPNKIKR
jgi:hypothetical protein